MRVRRHTHELIVDVHCHMVVRSAVDFMREAAPTAIRTMGEGNSLSAEVQRRHVAAIQLPLSDVPTRLKLMDEANIDIQALSPSPAHYYYGAPAEVAVAAHRMVNDHIAATVAAHPDRFVGMGVVPMQAPELAIAELRRVVKQLGFRGVEIGTNINGEDLSAARFRPFFAAAEELDVLIFLHPVGFTEPRRMTDYFLDNVIGNPLDSTIAVSHLIFGGVLKHYPRLKICVAHGGGFLPAYAGRMEHAYHAREDCRVDIDQPPSHYLRKLYFDSIVFDAAQLEYLVQRYGADRILLGTDFPYDMAEADAVGFIESAKLTDAQRAAILGGNAARLFDIPLKIPAR
ncbi:MAG: amidohydrolase family protein [Steroidobacteraceae bacterium]